MTLTVENGSIVADANSYLSLAEADAFHSDRGNAAWTGTNAVKEAALIRATDYIEQQYADGWKGELISIDQSLQWPRAGLDDVSFDEIPKALKHAVAILALAALTEDLNPDLDRGGMIKREKVDTIEVEYMDGARAGKSRPAAAGLIGRYLKSSTLNRPVLRA